MEVRGVAVRVRRGWSRGSEGGCERVEMRCEQAHCGPANWFGG